jgi:peptidoglycan/LPS O-acetylase OafA/YrhL
MTATSQTASRAGRQLPLVLPRLTSTRSLAAFAVFVFHLGHSHVLRRNPIPSAYALLAYFFILSGFVLTWSTPPDMPLRTYYRKRFARIWPNHLAMALVALLVPVTTYTPTIVATLANVLLIQAWVPKGSVLFGLNGVSWSLSVEVAFYAVLPLIVPWLRRRSTRQRWIAAAGVFLADSVVVLVAAHVGGNVATGGYTQPLLRAGEFLLGCVAALEIQRGWRLSKGVEAAVLVILVPVSFVLPHPIPSLNVFLTPAWLVLIIGWVQADLAGRGGPLTWKWLVYAGQVSFAFYLVHELVILNFQHWFHVSTVPLVALMALGSMVAAIALHHGVEQPAQRLLSRRGPRRAADSDRV